METTHPSGRDASSEASSLAGEAATRVSQRAHDAVDRMATTAHGVADRMSHHGEQLLARQDEMMQHVRGYVRERPMAALAIAAAVGFVLSRLSR
ncbi:MAG: DUF883 family protein [Burkholderiales bacterium]|nr:DUF883 family protein [Burkholderiales bacterium]